MPGTEDQVRDVRTVEHCWIPMRDGARLSARLWLPVLPKHGSTPAILEYIPYRKRDMVRARDERNHPYFASRGYACVRVDMRGSGDSEGVMTDMYSADELDDAVEVIEWIAKQPWCDGAVGMMGTSWGGTSTLQAAARRPEALKAIIAVCATDNRFDDDIHHMGGCLLTDTVEWGATLPAILAAPPDPETVGAAWRRIWESRLEGLGFALANWVEHETRDAYWRWGSVNVTPEAIACPALLIDGWADRYSNTVMNLLARSHDRCWGIVGPWGHHYPDVGCPAPGMGFQQEAVRWWDRWLKGIQNGVDEAPRLRVWVQEYRAPANAVDRRPGRWVSEQTWPSQTVRSRDLWIGAGRLAWEPGRESETLTVPSALEVGAAAGDTGYFGRDGGLPTAQDDDDAASLVFETQPLAEPLEILGSVRLMVSLASDQPIATLVARLNDVPPNGDTARVAYAVQNLALDEHGSAPRLMEPGEKRPFRVAFPNTGYKFERGHRLRLALSSSYWPLVWPAPRPAQITLHLADARLVLPVRGAGFESPVSFDAPLAVENTRVRVIAAPPLERSMHTDAATNHRLVEWRQPPKRMRFNEIDLEFGFETQAQHSIQLDAPTSARTGVEHRLHFSRAEWAVEVVGRAELTSTETSYRLCGSVEVRENGKLMFERQWDPVIPRTCS